MFYFDFYPNQHLNSVEEITYWQMKMLSKLLKKFNFILLCHADICYKNGRVEKTIYTRTLRNV